MCSNDDLKELGLTMGPRKKLSAFIAQENVRQKVAKERRVCEAAEKLKREQQAAKEAVDSAAMENLFGVKIIMGMAGTGQTYVKYPQLRFTPRHLFALGSPIGLFLTVRSVAVTSYAAGPLRARMYLLSASYMMLYVYLCAMLACKVYASIPFPPPCRGVEDLGPEFSLPTCGSVFNIFHPVRRYYF